MRAIVMGLALMLAIIPAAHPQQLAIAGPAPTAEPELLRVEAPTAAIVVDVAPAPIDVLTAPVEAVEAGRDVTEAKAAAQISAHNLLAIIGGVVVVVALVALFT